MKVKKRDLLRLHNAIHALEGKVFNVKFSYFIAKNKVAMRDEITALEEARKVSDEYKKYDTERATLAQQYQIKMKMVLLKFKVIVLLLLQMLNYFKKILKDLE